MNRSLNIVAADDDRRMREYYLELLPRLGHQAMAVRDGRQLVDLCRLMHPDLVLADVPLAGMDALAAAAEVNRERPTPVILVSAHYDAGFWERVVPDYILACLVKPVRPEQLAPTIALAATRFAHLQALSKEAADLRRALEDRKLVEQAKGAVMRRLGVDEPEAYRRMMDLAGQRHWPMVEVARHVLGAEQLFRQLDEPTPTRTTARPPRPAGRATPRAAPAPERAVRKDQNPSRGLQPWSGN